MKTLAYRTMTLPAACWRKTTWALITWTALVTVWAAAGIRHANQVCATSADPTACHAGATAGIALILIIGALGYIVLSLTWIMTKPCDA